MIINAAKAKIMTNTNNMLQIKVESGVLKQMECFVYLGSKTTKDAECKSEVRTRLVTGTSIRIN